MARGTVSTALWFAGLCATLSLLACGKDKPPDGARPTTPCRMAPAKAAATAPRTAGPSVEVLAVACGRITYASSPELLAKLRETLKEDFHATFVGEDGAVVENGVFVFWRDVGSDLAVDAYPQYCEVRLETCHRVLLRLCETLSAHTRMLTAHPRQVRVSGAMTWTAFLSAFEAFAKAKEMKLERYAEAHDQYCYHLVSGESGVRDSVLVDLRADKVFDVGVVRIGPGHPDLEADYLLLADILGSALKGNVVVAREWHDLDVFEKK